MDSTFDLEGAGMHGFLLPILHDLTTASAKALHTATQERTTNQFAGPQLVTMLRVSTLGKERTILTPCLGTVL